MTSFAKTPSSPRLAVRAVIVHDGRLLLVNAWPGGKSDLLCAPGGGVERGTSLPDNLKREVFEETGLRIAVDVPCLVNEFHDPVSGFHQVEIFFRCVLEGCAHISPNWQDPAAVVTTHVWVTDAEVSGHRIKPAALADLAFAPRDALTYDPLEQIVS